MVDAQFMDQMGSPYLLAHGLGEPVADARTHTEFRNSGHYRVFVKTYDWCAPWESEDPPGRFPAPLFADCTGDGNLGYMAGALCTRHNALPRDVYHDHLQDLIRLMQQGVGTP